MVYGIFIYQPISGRSSNPFRPNQNSSEWLVLQTSPRVFMANIILTHPAIVLVNEPHSFYRESWKAGTFVAGTSFVHSINIRQHDSKDKKSSWGDNLAILFYSILYWRASSRQHLPFRQSDSVQLAFLWQFLRWPLLIKKKQSGPRGIGMNSTIQKWLLRNTMCYPNESLLRKLS